MPAPGDVDQVVDVALGIHAGTEADSTKCLDGRPLQHARPHPAEHVVAGAQFEHDRVDPGPPQQVREQGARRPCPDDHHWNLHVVPPPADCTQDCRQSGTVGPVIIDCHGHYTTTPPGVGEWRDAQVAAVDLDPFHVGEKGTIDVTDDEIRASLESAQLAFQRERGADLTLFSPRASWMAHHVGNEHTSMFWSQHQNELIRRVCDLYPSNFAPVCQLPQSPGVAIDGSVAELRRCVGEMGFVGCNVNPDPSGGFWTGPPLWDRYWWPLWETMCELDVPAMIHVSASCNENLFTTGSHYLGADTTAFMQALSSGFMRDFPTLRWIIPHGGGAVPVPLGSLQGDGGRPRVGLRRSGRPRLLRHVRVPPARHRPARRRRADREHPVRLGDGRCRAGHRPRHRQPLRRHEDLHRPRALDDDERELIFHDNVRRVFPRLVGGADR